MSICFDIYLSSQKTSRVHIDRESQILTIIKFIIKFSPTAWTIYLSTSKEKLFVTGCKVRWELSLGKLSVTEGVGLKHKSSLLPARSPGPEPESGAGASPIGQYLQWRPLIGQQLRGLYYLYWKTQHIKYSSPHNQWRDKSQHFISYARRNRSITLQCATALFMFLIIDN